MEEHKVSNDDLKDSLTYTNTLAASAVRDLSELRENRHKLGKSSLESHLNKYPIEPITEEIIDSEESLTSPMKIKMNSHLKNRTVKEELHKSVPLDLRTTENKKQKPTNENQKLYSSALPDVTVRFHKKRANEFNKKKLDNLEQMILASSGVDPLMSNHSVSKSKLKIKAKYQEEFGSGPLKNNEINEPFSQSCSGISDRTHAINESSIFEFENFNENDKNAPILEQQEPSNKDSKATSCKKISENIPEKTMNLMLVSSKLTAPNDSQQTLSELFDNIMEELREKYTKNHQTLFQKNIETFNQIMETYQLKEPIWIGLTPSQFITTLVSIIIRRYHEVMQLNLLADPNHFCR